MATNTNNISSVQQQQYQPPQQQQQQLQQQQQGHQQYHCKECGLNLNSAESLDVHLQYHKENLLKHWAIQAATSQQQQSQHSEETNNNTPKGGATTTTANNVKREFIQNNTVAPADSSDSNLLKKSPEYNNSSSRATPEMILGYPPTPQSYRAASPYQNHDFSPNFQNFQIKNERQSPNPYYSYANNPNANNADNFFNQQQQIDVTPYPQQDYLHKSTSAMNNSYRYHPYGGNTPAPYDRQQQPQQSQVSSSSPAYPPQPTPSPSPKQCDKCGYVCESASQLIEHLHIAHPPTPAPHYQQQQNQQSQQQQTQQQQNHFMFDHTQAPQPTIKTEEEAQSEILDLDSHKVHHYQEEEKRQNESLNAANHSHPHSVNSMLNSWPQQNRMFMPNPLPSDQKMFPMPPGEQKPFGDQKMFAPQQPQMHGQEFMANGVSPNSDTVNSLPPQNYRPFEHLPSQAPNAAPVITSTQVPNNPTPPSTKSTNWKSNEARRPKTYNCTACNKWFTSSGHLKRHYNTTLHKNAVKTSNQPDPATMPISAHHHPARDNNSNKEDSSTGDESRGEDTNSMPPQFERLNAMPGLLQQPPNGPYDRQPAPNIHHTPPLHSPMQSHTPHSNSLTNLSNGNSPNGEAGPSTNSLDSRGLLSTMTSPHNTTPQHGYNMAIPTSAHIMAPPPHSMESNQFQMYPNESAPHVTQVMVINNLNTTGELLVPAAFINNNNNKNNNENKPLPSFSQFQVHRYGIVLGYGNANVGGGGSVTTPYTYYQNEATSPYETNQEMYRNECDEDYKLTVLTNSTATNTDHESQIIESAASEYTIYSPTQNNNNNSDNLLSMATMESETKMHVMEDIKMRLEAQPASPEKAHTKRDYEENMGSPRITSTVITKTGQHKCFDCDKVFNKACYLTQHNKTFHSGDKPFKCTRCGKRFSCEITYQGHSTKHAGEKPHKCDLCPKQFNHKTDLRRHMCLHTGQKPYACDTCGKGFIRKDHMLKHCETHLRKTQAKIAIR